MLWPPATTMPAAAQARSPPCRMPRMVSCGSTLIGMPTMASANSGRAPIAYRSDSALVAAMRPKSNGSSTIGMKKSVVATIAWRSSRRYTAASSLVSRPPSSSAGAGSAGIPRSSSESTPGAILQPQPPPWASEVRRGGASAGEGAGDCACVAMPTSPAETPMAEGSRSRTYQGTIDAPYWV
ncbi:hypothetical protein G6F54_013529 [Rhizopus delemar]|nr:hypothetical protein G6F54_013529 [Rhizopus delemar]